MKYIFYAATFFILFGCASKIEERDLQNLNGYWEIEQVIFEDGSVKEYGVNTTVDFISLEGLKGYRKKVQPKLDGGYFTSNDAIPFQIFKPTAAYIIQYDQGITLDTRIPVQESILEISENSFTIIDMTKNKYRYKRFQPIKVEN